MKKFKKLLLRKLHENAFKSVKQAEAQYRAHCAGCDLEDCARKEFLFGQLQLALGQEIIFRLKSAEFEGRAPAGTTK